MGETRKIAAILVADIVGYSRLAGADEDRTLSRLRGLRSDLIDPAIDAHHGRIVKRTGDGICSTGTRQLRHGDCARDDRIMAEYGLPAGLHPDFEIDHLIPVEIGGTDDARNLWPEPGRSIEPQWNAEARDRPCIGAPARRESTEDWPRKAGTASFAGAKRGEASLRTAIRDARCVRVSPRHDIRPNAARSRSHPPRNGAGGMPRSDAQTGLPYHPTRTQHEILAFPGRHGR